MTIEQQVQRAREMVKRPDSVLGYVKGLGLHREGAMAYRSKAAVGAGTATDPDYSSLTGVAGMSEFQTYQERQLVPARLNLARAPFHAKTPIQTGDPAAAYWVSETEPKPVTRFAASHVSLSHRKVAALTVVERDLLRSDGALTDAAISRALSAPLAARVNSTFLSDAAAVAGEAPAGVAAGVTPVPTTGDAQADIESLIDAADAADVDLATAAFVLSPARAARYASALGLQNLGLRGGELMGAPAVTDRAAGDSVYLIATDRIALAIGAVDIDSAEHASVLMADDPATGAAELTSLWQTDSVAYVVELFINWEALPNSVFILSDVS